MTRQPPQPPEGFTVVELLTSLLILSLLSLVSYRGLSAVLATRAQVAAETRKWQQLDAFLQRFRRDVALAAPRPARTTEQILPAWQGQPDNETIPLLAFSRFAEREGADRPRRLGYALNPQRVVELWLWPGLDLAAGTQPLRYPLLHDIRRFELHYLDGQHAWQDRWPPSAHAPRLPDAVRLTIVLGTGEEVVRVFGVGS